jgi:branched-chain amino acid transport system permease protein
MVHVLHLLRVTNVAFAQLSQIRLEYFARGEGPQRVLFIHGFQASARIWHAVQHELPTDRYTTIAINNRGAGGSDAPASEHAYGVPTFAIDAFELVQQLGWRDFTLVGHSLGGATVAQFAVDHPELLQGLVLLDPSDPDGRDASPEEIDRIVDERMAARRAQRARGRRGGDGIDAGQAGGSEEWLQLLTADIEAAPEARLRGSMRSMYALRLGDQVRALSMPVLLAGGDGDALIPLGAMLSTWAKYPEGTGLHMWHGIGHSPNVECPGELAAVLRHFIEVTIPARRNGAAAD